MKANRWQQLSPSGFAPAAREGHTAVWSPSDDGLYIFGGNGVSGIPASRFVCFLLFFVSCCFFCSSFQGQTKGIPPPPPHTQTLHRAHLSPPAFPSHLRRSPPPPSSSRLVQGQGSSTIGGGQMHTSSSASTASKTLLFPWSNLPSPRVRLLEGF